MKLFNLFKRKPSKEVVLEDKLAKTYNKKVTLLILDNELISVTKTDYTGAKIDVVNPVPLISNDKNIGAATVYTEGKALVADLFIKYDCPERLDLENGVLFWAHPQFYSETLPLPPSGYTVKKMYIKSVYLTMEKTMDPRVPNV